MRTAAIIAATIIGVAGFNSAVLASETVYENDWRAGYTGLIHDGQASEAAVATRQAQPSSEIAYENDYRAGYTGLIRGGHRHSVGASREKSATTEDRKTCHMCGGAGCQGRKR